MAVIAVVVLPVTRLPSISWDILTSASYVVNWRLADQSVDYLAAESAPSPVQHFWSLAVEEQFYLVWPVLALCLLALARSRRWRPRRALFAGVLLIGLSSLAWSIHLTVVDPGRAYFVTTTRAWELALGAALALLAPRLLRLPRPVAEMLAGHGQRDPGSPPDASAWVCQVVVAVGGEAGGLGGRKRAISRPIAIALVAIRKEARKPCIVGTVTPFT